MITFQVTAFFVLIFLSGYYSAAETAFFSLSQHKIKAYASSKDARKRLIAFLLIHPRNLLVTVFLMNTLTNILFQNVVSSMFGDNAPLVLKVGVPLVVMLIFGEIIPKYLGIQNNEWIANLVAPSINFTQNITKHIRDVIIAVTAPVSRIMFFFLRSDESISKEELQHVLKKSEEKHILSSDEAKLIYGYLNLQDATVKEVMWPREDILYFDINEPLTKLIYLFVDQQISRVPVCDGNIQNVKGIISVKEFLVHRDDIHNSQDLIPFLAKPFYVPESTAVRSLRKKLEEDNQELAMVVDEYGSITGLITYEDLVEVVIGNIADLRDKKSLYTRSGPNEIIASGKLELLDFNEVFDSNLESPNNMVTLGGWITEQLGYIPKSGTKFESDGFLFQILAANPNRIRRLYVRKLSNRKKK